MDLDFTSEQEMLRDSAARFMANECPYERVKEIEESAEGYDPNLWQQVIELGWTGLLFPEEYGGYGGQFMDLVIILEQMGKAVFPSPFFSTIVQCGLTIQESGTEEQKTDLLARISEGSLIMALAQYEEDGSWEPASLSMEAEPQGEDGFRPCRHSHHWLCWHGLRPAGHLRIPGLLRLRLSADRAAGHRLHGWPEPGRVGHDPAGGTNQGGETPTTEA